MTNAELRALGIPEETISKIQEIHQADLKYYHERLHTKENQRAVTMKTAILKMLDVISEADSFKKILSTVNYAYRLETKLDDES